MTRIRAEEPALRRGRQVVRAYGDKPGLFALSRVGEDGSEILALFNTSTAPVAAQVEVEPGSLRWQALRGDCAPKSSAPASVAVRVPPRLPRLQERAVTALPLDLSTADAAPR